MFVNGDHLFRSTDKGETWSERTLPASDARGGRIAFTSDRDGYFLVTDPATAPCPQQNVTLWRTQDGAVTWQRIDTKGIDPAGCKGTPYFVDAEHGYIPTYDDPAGPRILRTADAGRTWVVSQRLPDPPGARFSDIRPFADAVADFGSVLLTDVHAVQGASAYYVYRSTDRGATWSFASTAPVLGVPIVFVTATRWLQIISPSDSRETTDGGASWRAFQTDYQQAAPVAAQIVFGDASTGYATVRGGLMRTIDGGAHWTGLKTPGT